MEKMSHMDVKFMWGNSNYDFVCSDALGNSGGILCMWESSNFKKDNVTISDNFVAIYGTWLTSNVMKFVLRRKGMKWVNERFMKKLQDLKAHIRKWLKDKRENLSRLKHDIEADLRDIDKELDTGLISDMVLERLLDLKGQLHDIKAKESVDFIQKSKTDPQVVALEKSFGFGYGGVVLENFQFSTWSKQGDPLTPLLFILVMESLHLAFSRVVEAGIFKGIRLNNSLALSHLFYADDALIIGEWSRDNLWGIINVLKCFYLASGLQINIHKSQLLGVGVSRLDIETETTSIGCSIMDNQFCYLGVMVGSNMSRHKAWVNVVLKLRSRLSKWKAKTLSIGGRLTLLKSVLGASPLYTMSIFKVPKDKVLASKKNEGLGVSSYFALNRALLCKWIWRFISQEDSLWFHVIQALYGSNISSHLTQLSSNWCYITGNADAKAERGGEQGRGDGEEGRRAGGGGRMGGGEGGGRTGMCGQTGERRSREAKKEELEETTQPPPFSVLPLPSPLPSLSLSGDRFFGWIGGLDWLFGVLFYFCGMVLLRDFISWGSCSRWVLIGLFLGGGKSQLGGRDWDCWGSGWDGLGGDWDLDWQPWSSFSTWDTWFSSIKLAPNNKKLLEGVFYVAWWSIWVFRNRLFCLAHPNYDKNDVCDLLIKPPSRLR
ncbi:RNA-directed DNA polymerase, eukaryota [Tanacetum coccineum]